jgi:hypothetical protein
MPIQAVFSPMIQGNARGGTMAQIPNSINSLDMPKTKNITHGHERDSSMVVHMEE